MLRLAAITASILLTIFFLWLLRLFRQKGLNPFICVVIGVISLGIICFLANAAAVYAFSLRYGPYALEALSSSPGSSFTSPEFGWVPLWEHHNPMAHILGFVAIAITLIAWSLIAKFSRTKII